MVDTVEKMLMIVPRHWLLMACNYPLRGAEMLLLDEPDDAEQRTAEAQGVGWFYPLEFHPVVGASIDFHGEETWTFTRREVRPAGSLWPEGVRARWYGMVEKGGRDVADPTDMTALVQ